MKNDQKITEAISLDALHETISAYIAAHWRRSMNEPRGVLAYKFLDPAAAYRGQLWDWDSYFCGLGLQNVYEDISDYVQGCVMNFLSLQRKDGSIPYMITVSDQYMEALPELSMEARDEKSDLNSIKPLLAQMALLARKEGGDDTWLRQSYDGLKRHILHWEQTQQTPCGLFVWRSYRGSGTDNHPGLYGRPLNSSAGVELNCFMCMEYRAMAKIAALCDDAAAVAAYTDKAEKLARVINARMWDPVDEIYYHLDMLSQKPPLARQEVFWNVPLKFKAWTSFMPMYAGVATPEYAGKLVEKHLMNPDEFYSDYGIRTMARNEPIYNTVETGNPSNWQGPIWIVSTYLIFQGLLNYGYYPEAETIARNLLTMLCRDIEENGAMHEYYNPETGTSGINLGFMNWNALAGQMVPALKKYRQERK